MHSYAPRYYAPRVVPGYGYVPYGYASGLGEYGFPPLAALLPLAAKAIGAIAPVAAKAAGAILPIAGKAAGALTPMVSNLLPQLLTSLPGLIPRSGGLPGLPLLPGMATPATPFAPAVMPAAAPIYLPAPAAPGMVSRSRRRRPRRRSLVRVLRDRNTGVVKAVRPIVAVPAPAPAVSVPVPVVPATEASCGMAGFHGYGFGYPFAGLHACGHCGGLHGPGRRCCAC